MSMHEPGKDPNLKTGEASMRKVDSLSAFFEESRKLIGKPVTERAHWNTEVSADSVRHFAWGISDDNPLWVDPDYAARGPHGRLAAPPAFLFSVLYPFLHGAAPSFPLTFLISDIDCRWYLPILEGDKLTATAAHKEVIQVPDRAGRNTVHIIAETTYRNQDDKVVGMIEGTIAAIERTETEMIVDREISAYSAEDVEALGAALREETRTGGQSASNLRVQPGDELPPIVRGPMTLGDLINWQVAIGPSYRAGALAYRDLLEKPHTATTMPQVGWPVRYSQQHEDFTLTKQRGMPAPFDNSSMRVAWISVLLTNWMGDNGFLRRLRISTVRPVIYGDTNWYTGKVTRTLQAGDEILVSIRLTGTNQLGDITTNGEAEVALPRRLSRLSEQENQTARQVEIAWGNRDLVVDAVTVCELFARQVQARPESVALVCGDQTLTYSALDNQSDVLSQEFVERGILPGSRLGLYLDRRADAVVAIFACAKAGIAYVPLDLSYPAAQLSQMLQEAALDFVLTDSQPFLTESEMSPEQISLESLIQGEPNKSAESFSKYPSVDAPAYVMFTSGSTGRKKAVAVDHRSLGLYLCAIIDALDVTANDVCLHTASFSFSASVRQLWLPLCTGSKLVLLDEETRRNPVTLFEKIRSEAITVWDTVPSVLGFAIGSLQDLDEGRRLDLLNNQLRQIFTTGEPLSWDTVHAWNKLSGKIGSIVNLYSQTETAGTVCIYPVKNVDSEKKGFVPLGRPVAHMGVCLLAEQLQAVEDGEVGEICVAGDRLASSELGTPAVSSERFVEVTLPDGNQACVFRTGDLGRQNAEGLLEFVGRTDDQLKIRGLRVRLGEVEAALKRDPRVAQGAVIATAEGEAEVEASLIAYVVPETDLRVDIHDLREKIARWLPGFMLPRSIVVLDALPLTPNGKLDRLALPHPEPEPVRNETVVPRNPTEEMLTTIWCEVLHIDKVSVHDDFFDLGGHSLSATRIINRVECTRDIKLPLL